MDERIWLYTYDASAKNLSKSRGHLCQTAAEAEKMLKEGWVRIPGDVKAPKGK